ncbi:MAG: phage holin family protein [Synergistaceae bacterium]|nr:phage holin family protein [Synergistaceae bacterium]
MNDQFHEFLISSLVGLLGWFFGGLDGFFKVLITFAVVDQISGICAAGIQGKISSEAGFKGIARKVIMFLFVGISHVIDKHIFGGTDALRTAVCLFYIGNEGISIIENAEALGVPIPAFLHGKFLSFAKKGLEEDIKEKLLKEKEDKK